MSFLLMFCSTLTPTCIRHTLDVTMSFYVELCVTRWRILHFLFISISTNIQHPTTLTCINFLKEVTFSIFKLIITNILVWKLWNFLPPTEQESGFHILCLANFQLPLTQNVGSFLSFICLFVCSAFYAARSKFIFISSRVISTNLRCHLCAPFLLSYSLRSLFMAKFIHTFERKKKNELKFKTNFQSLRQHSIALKIVKWKTFSVPEKDRRRQVEQKSDWESIKFRLQRRNARI